MKKLYFYTILFLAAAITLIPIPNLFGKEPEKQTIQTSSVKKKSQDSDVFNVLCKKTDKVIQVDEYSYICGVIAAEMPASYNIEALKAQAVAAHTLAKRAVLKNDGSNKELEGADFSDDADSFQGYLTESELKAKYGDKYEENMKKIKSAVDSVFGEILVYDNEPALTVYHEISGGKTESGQNGIGEDKKYLKQVPSAGDLLSEKYQTEITIKSDDIKKKLESLDIKWIDTPSKWFTGISNSKAGTVLEINICGTKIKGSNLKKLLSLKSSNFDVFYKDKIFTFTCRGIGHGVGMSQNGANYMAESGSTYKEILDWYYNGCTLEKIQK